MVLAEASLLNTQSRDAGASLANPGGLNWTAFGSAQAASGTYATLLLRRVLSTLTFILPFRREMISASEARDTVESGSGSCAQARCLGNHRGDAVVQKEEEISTAAGALMEFVGA